MRGNILKLLSVIVLIAGVGNLAASQIHVGTITKIFDNRIGIFLFLFIIFGMTTGFNGMLIDKFRSLISLIVSGLLASGSGFIYLRILEADVASQDKLTMADVSQSHQIVIVSIVIYLIGALVLPVLSWPDVKLASR